MESTSPPVVRSARVQSSEMLEPEPSQSPPTEAATLVRPAPATVVQRSEAPSLFGWTVVVTAVAVLAAMAVASG
jgi:hypothetical protein